MSQINVDNIKNRLGSGAPSFPNGIDVSSGVTTFTNGLNVGTGASVFSPGTNELALGTNSAERVRIDSTGNVGVGTDNPDTNLTVLGNTDGVLNLDTTDARGAFVRFKENGTSKAWVGCSEGIGSGGDQDDLGLRAVDNIRFRAGSSYVTIDNSGNIVMGSGQGIDFSANGNAAGMTSELLDDYEEGTWTPSGEFAVNGTRTNVDMRGSYTKVGDVVTINFYTQVTKGTASGLYEIHGLPFTASSKTYSMAIPLGFSNMNVTNPLFGSLVSGNTKLVILQADANPPTNVEASDMNTSNAVVNGTFVYYAS